jgi:hypothetical protein
MHPAIKTGPAGVTEPGNADAFTHPQAFDASTDRIDPTDDLVARDDGQMGIWQFAVDDMQVGAADAASQYLDANLARSRMPARSVHSSAVLSFLSTIACMAASLFTVKAHFAVDRLIKVADLEPAN